MAASDKLQLCLAALLVAVLLVAMSCGGVASAAGPPNKNKQPPPSRAGDGRLPPPRNSKNKFVTLTSRMFGKKRNYEVSCVDKENPAGCYVGCPRRCPNQCIVFCSYCLSFCECDIFPGTSCGDPRFTGGDGNTFYFHGRKDDNFCIVSDADLHINAHFIGNHNPELKRDFTWVQALGVTFLGASDDHRHRLYIGARRAAEWDEEEDHIQITLDAEPIDIDTVKDARWESTAAMPGLFSVMRMKDVNTVTVELAGVFRISANAVPITDEDNRIHKYGKKKSNTLVHLDLGFQFHNLTKDVDGVLGQTYRPDYVTKLDIRAKMPIMGGAPKYLSSGLFTTDCVVSRFRRRAPPQHSSTS